MKGALVILGIMAILFLIAGIEIHLKMKKEDRKSRDKKAK